ncbi:MAG: hypothetical protein ACWGPR_10830 [Candidatus Deferrimicrobiaceae bacterium]
MSEDIDDIEREGPRSFGVFLNGLADGEAMAACSHDLHELVQKLQEESVAQNKDLRGELKLSIQLIADPKGFVAVGYDIATKAPKPQRSGSMMWITRGGNLSLENPRQQKLPLREVELTGRRMREPNYDQNVKEIP